MALTIYLYQTVRRTQCNIVENSKSSIGSKYATNSTPTLTLIASTLNVISHKRVASTEKASLLIYKHLCKTGIIGNKIIKICTHSHVRNEMNEKLETCKSSILSSKENLHFFPVAYPCYVSFYGFMRRNFFIFCIIQ